MNNEKVTYCHLESIVLKINGMRNNSPNAIYMYHGGFYLEGGNM